MADLTLLVLRCRNLELSRSFYETLGLTFAPERHGSGPEHYSTRLGQTVLELYPAAEPATLTRIGLRIDDLQRVLVALATSVVQVNTDTFPPSALLRDPDGNKVELTSP
jgi:lactoylglutathione lyase